MGIALPFHPGATAYYNGDPPNLLEMFEDYVYLMAIIGSVIGAVVAWILSAWRRALSPDQEQLLRLLAIVGTSLPLTRTLSRPSTRRSRPFTPVLWSAAPMRQSSPSSSRSSPRW